MIFPSKHKKNPARYPESSPYLHHLFIRNAATFNYFYIGMHIAYIMLYLDDTHTHTHTHMYTNTRARAHTHTHTVQLLFTILYNFVDLKIIMTNIFLLNLSEYCLIPHGNLWNLLKNLTIISLINCPEKKKNVRGETRWRKKSRLTESQQNGYVRFWRL